MTFPVYFTNWLRRGTHKCLLAEVTVRVGGVEITRYISNIGFTTNATDTPANTCYQSRICGGGEFSRSLDLSGGGGSLSFGDLELGNQDGALDTWLDDVWANRSITLKMGDINWPVADFVTVFSGIVKDIQVKSKTRLALVLRDILHPLNAPFTTTQLGGTGPNKDSLLPITLGEVFNVQPLLISTSGTQTYQVSQGAIEQIIEVRDNGYPVAYTADAANGKFSLTNARWGQITCDVQGAKVSSSYRNDVGGLIEWVATTLGDGIKLTSGDIDSTVMTAFRTAHTQPIGIYCTDRENRLELMQRMASSIGATVTAGLDGKLRLVQLAFGTASRTISTDDMKIDSFEPVSKLPVQGAVTLRGCLNSTVQQESSLAAAVSSSQKTALGREWIIATSEDTSVTSIYKQTDLPTPSDTHLIVESDLQAEAARRNTLWKTPRTVYRFQGFSWLFDLELGDTITLKHPRLGLSSGKTALITSITTNFLTAESTIEVLV